MGISQGSHCHGRRAGEDKGDIQTNHGHPEVILEVTRVGEAALPMDIEDNRVEKAMGVEGEARDELEAQARNHVLECFYDKDNAITKGLMA